MTPWMTAPTYTPSRGTAWLLIVVGALAVIAGVIALVFPGITLLNLILIFGWYAIFTGILQIVHAFTGDRTAEGRVLLAVRGLIALALGIVALLMPGITLGAFVLLLAAFLFVTGVFDIIAAFRGHLHGWLLVWGVIAIIGAIVAVAYPGIAALSLAIIFGVYAILGGITAIMGGIAALRAPHDRPFPMPHSRAG
ncbi:MAG TPA: DUF308 domain-containing protein [Chloroflexota bacterium]|nr:DUF308 domain-containing protein [Chloroflexota bacterium]